MSVEKMAPLWGTVTQFIAGAATAIIAWLVVHQVAFVALGLGLLIFWPVKYRKVYKPEEEKKYELDHWVRIPFIFAGFCELAVVVFDRFKPPEKEKVG